MSGQSPAIVSKLPQNSVKSSISSLQVSPATSQIQQFFSGDSGQRRSSSSSSKVSAPRNNQSSKPKHKHKHQHFRVLDEDAEAETFSMQNPHGRRGQQSITHLMQFSLPPRPQTQHNNYRHGGLGGRGARRNPTWGLGSGYHAVDKARYIHANYRFIVHPRGDYRAQAEDADLYLDWINVLQVVASSKTQAASCPICLGEPTAPRIAKCGHIFCLPCLIRYMHSEDGTQHGASTHPQEKRARWKKCPICWDSIYISETRSVRWYEGQESEPREGADIVLRLVKRKAGTTLAMPRESASPVEKGEGVPWYFAAEVMDYARVMKGSEQYMMQQYEEALAAVEQIEKEDELMFGEDAEWTGRAKRFLQDGKEKVRGIGDPPAQPRKPEQTGEAKPERPAIQFNDSESGVPDMYLHKHADAPPRPTDMPVTDDSSISDAARSDSNYVPRTLHEMRERQLNRRPEPNEYLFYQALLHYYLSPLDIRILKSTFQSYSNLPSSILPRVERVSSGHIVDDELRKRVKYLAHLPYGCEVGFLECDWSDTVPESVLEEFQPMIERRRRRNEEKEAREEKERVRIEKAEEREYAAVRRKRPSLPEDMFSSAQLPSLGSGIESEVANALLAEGTVASSPPWTNRSTAGFASLASPSTSPTAHRTVWGTTAVTPNSPEVHAALPRDTEMNDDGWLQGWEKDLLDQQYQELTTEMESVSVQSGQPQKGGGAKKGKKSKKITLMSTTARRGA